VYANNLHWTWGAFLVSTPETNEVTRHRTRDGASTSPLRVAFTTTTRPLIPLSGRIRSDSYNKVVIGFIIWGCPRVCDIQCRWDLDTLKAYGVYAWWSLSPSFSVLFESGSYTENVRFKGPTQPIKLCIVCPRTGHVSPVHPW